MKRLSVLCLAAGLILISITGCAPTFSPEPGIYSDDIDVTISCEMESAAIHYTTDGSEPTTESTLYTEAIPVSDYGTEVTIKAISAAGSIISPVVSATYSIQDKAATPQFNPPGGTFNNDIEVEITCDTVGATIYYTTDGTNPDEDSTEYIGPVAVSSANSPMMIRAIAIKDGMIDSDIVTGTYTILGLCDACISTAAELQAALTTAASNGQDDTICVEQGTYYGSFIYASTESYGLSIGGGYTSECDNRVLDPYGTVLDAEGIGVVLAVSVLDVAADIKVEGLTLQNGSVVGTHGGGLFIKTAGGNASILSDLIINNTANSNGSTSIHGGGVYIEGMDTVALESNLISNNTTTGSPWCFGGGLAIQFSGIVTLGDNIFLNNEAIRGGGGAFFHSLDSVSMNRNRLNNNYSDSSEQGGGGVHINTVNNAILTNNIFTENRTWGYGGGVHVFHVKTVNIINNTITDNRARTGGGSWIQLYSDDGTALIYNNIIWNNVMTSDNKDFYINNDGNNNYIPSPVLIFNNDFDQSTAGTYIQLPFTIDPSNLDNADPLFVDALNDDYHLTSTSPCLDVGTNSAPELPGTDFEGDDRVIRGTVDMGADEFMP